MVVSTSVEISGSAATVPMMTMATGS